MERKEILCQKKIYNNDVLARTNVGIGNDDVLTWTAAELDNISNVLREHKQNQKNLTCINKEPFCVFIKDECIYIGGVNVLSKRAKIQYAIFELLIDQYFNSHIMSRSKSEYLTVQQLMLQLELKYKIEISQESQIRRPIAFLREKIHKILFIPKDALIEVTPWHGYRLNPMYVKLG